jgi:hypothetical protein
MSETQEVWPANAVSVGVARVKPLYYGVSAMSSHITHRAPEDGKAVWRRGMQDIPRTTLDSPPPLNTLPPPRTPRRRRINQLFTLRIPSCKILLSFSRGIAFRCGCGVTVETTGTEGFEPVAFTVDALHGDVEA